MGKRDTRDAVVIGLGQLGRLFGAAALARGVRVTPVLRGDDLHERLAGVERGAPVFVTVGEQPLAGVLAALPPERREDVVLVQNELFPDAWRGIASPTVAVVWSNVKKGRPIEVGRATHVFGPHAAFVCELHGAVDVPCETLASEGALEEELVAKYAFIVGLNTLGMVDIDNGAAVRTVGAWLDGDLPRVERALAHGAELGAARLSPDRRSDDSLRAEAQAIARGALEALRAMPAAGRSAPDRVARARAVAARLGVASPW